MCFHLEATVLVQMASKGVQKMQNHTEQVPKPLKISDSDTTKKIFFGWDFLWGSHKPILSSVGAPIYIYKNECLCVCFHLEATVLVQMGSKGAQKMQNHTEQVPKPLKISDSDTTKNNILWVGFSGGKAQAHSELNWGPYLSIYICLGCL